MSLYTDKTGLAYLLSKLKDKFDNRFLRNPVDGNLKVNGNLEVTGNSNINGKLTVDSLDIKNNFTVAGGTPVTGDALQKVQDQIIAPEQEFFVDQKNGNDNNDGKTIGKAFRTLDRVFAVLRPNIPKVIINLITYKEPENKIYNTFTLSSMIENNTLKIGYLFIRGLWDVFESDRIVAKIIVPYGKVNTGQSDFSTSPITYYYQWGRFFIHGCKGCTLQSVIFEFPTDTADTTKFRNAVFYAFEGSLEMNNFSGNTMNLPPNCNFFFLPASSNIDTLYFEKSMSEASIITGDSLLTKGQLSYIYPKDPRTDTSNGKQGTALTTTISKYINLNVSFGANVLGSTSGLDSNIYTVYKRGFSN